MINEKHTAIGVFDSGLGGLTIVKALKEAMPSEQVLYVGDTAHLPYGDKTPALVQEYSKAIAHFLIAQGVKAIVIACNTASAVAYEAVAEIAGDVPVFEVIGPAVQEATKQSQSNHVGVIGTRTTIASGEYRKRLEEKLSPGNITDKATPLLVPMIEEGWLHNQVSQDVIDAYMSDTGFSEIDTLILGCTHYPLIKHQIKQYFEKSYDHDITLIDSSIVVAEAVRSYLDHMELSSPKAEKKDRFFLTDYSAHFIETAALFLGGEMAFEATYL